VTEQNHNFEIETALLHFQSALDGAIINRYAGDWADPSQNLTTRNAEQKIKVNYVFGPKQRIIADLEGKTDTVKFPIVAICPTGMGRDDTRIKNKNETIKFRLQDGNYGNFNVVPWNINVSVTIMTRFQEDMTQIISNFAVVSNPYIVFSWREPKTGLDVRAEVYWDGQMAMEYPGASSDLPPNAPFRVMGTANFVIKTFLYRTEIENTAKICKIDTDIIIPHKFYCNYDSLSEESNINGIDNHIIEGRPQLRYVDNWYMKVGDTKKITIQGDGFALTNAIYLSGDNPETYPLKEYFYGNEKFQGYIVPEFEIIDSQHISFILPPPSAFGFVDVIAINECGFGQLTVEANRCARVLNPYPPDNPNHYNWCVSQFPYLNGLVISNNLNDNFEIDPNEEIIYFEQEVVDKDAVLQQILSLMKLADISIEEINNLNV
jgi:hypothetical protein